MQERDILEENYAFLRKVEHRLQIMFDLQTHTLPERSPRKCSDWRSGWDIADDPTHARWRRSKRDLQPRPS